MTTTSHSEIQSALSEIARRFSDTRIQHCQIEIDRFDGRVCTLSGSVLDMTTLDVVGAALSDRFHDIAFDASAVRILRQAQPRWLTVVTNVTSVNARPGLTAERMSQVMGGWRVELLQEEGSWAFVRQEDGYLGWVYRGHLSDAPGPEPTHVVCIPISILRSRPDEASPLTGRMTAGEKVAVRAQEEGWGQVNGGWLPMAHLRPLDAPLADEDARLQMVTDAVRFLGVPYLWGGCTGFGIDCSGFARLLHQLSGLALPRDADMQFRAGRPVEPPFRPGDLLFFGGKGEGRAITHVGMSLGGWRMIHASVSRNGVYIDDVQAVGHLRKSFAGARAFV